MSTILLQGAPVAQAIYEKAAKVSASLAEKGVTPVVALVRVGENPADISYENSIKKNDVFNICFTINSTSMCSRFYIFGTTNIKLNLPNSK